LQEVSVRFTYPTALVLRALLDGRHHGFDIMEATGLPSGTVYPILRRLDSEALVRSRWEDAGVARRELRPPRRYYELTPGGRGIARDAIARYRSVQGARLRGRAAEA
jgi:DNA-binding PadR family transcriptional regulator